MLRPDLPSMASPIVRTERLTRSFGSLMAVAQVDFEVERGELRSIIGPNGAGKTTLFNLVTGVYAPDEGDILFEGESILGLAPNRITRRGVARTFQTLRLFLNMTVKENVMAAAYGHTHAGIVRSVLRTPGLRRSVARVIEEESATVISSAKDTAKGEPPAKTSTDETIKQSLKTDSAEKVKSA